MPSYNFYSSERDRPKKKKSNLCNKSNIQGMGRARREGWECMESMGESIVFENRTMEKTLLKNYLSQELKELRERARCKPGARTYSVEQTASTKALR